MAFGTSCTPFGSSARNPAIRSKVLARIVGIAGKSTDPDDGVRYLTDTAKARIIRESDLYSGVRVTMNATVGRRASNYNSTSTSATR